MFAFLNENARLFESLGSAIVMESIGWTLFHFLWQGALIAAVVGLVLSLMNRCSANNRYWVACAGLSAMAVVPVATLIWVSSQQLTKPVSAAKLNVMSDLSGEPHVWDSKEFAEEGAAGSEAESNFGSGFSSIGTVENATSGESKESMFPKDSAKNVDMTASSEAGSSNVAESSNSWLIALQSQMVPYLPWLVAVWFLGVCWLSIRMIWAWFKVQGIKSSGTELTDQKTVGSFKRMAGRLGLSGKATILQSSQVVVPTVIGWLKPVVLMPVSAMTGLNSQQLSAILAHELAHIRRADYLVNLAQSFVETVLFYHPCVWWLSARIRVERENCCDDLATEICGGARSYAEALLRLEQTKSADSENRPALTMGADGASLVERVARLLGKKRTQNRSPYWLVGVFTLTIALTTIAISVPNNSALASLVSAELPGQKQQEEVDPGNPKSAADKNPLPQEIKITVLDSDGEPLEGAHLHAGVWSNDRTFGPNQMEDTGADGTVTFKMPEDYYILRLWASAEGHTRLYAQWEEESIKAGDVPPSEYTFKMIKGSTISGVIQDEMGNPIAGAKVGIQGSATHPDEDPHLRYGYWYAEGSGSGGDTRLITDKEGRWSLNTLPPADDLKIKLTVAHPDFIDDPKGDLQKAQAVTTEQLRDGTAVIKMVTGTVLTGKIFDEDGKPLENGIVVWGDQPYWESGPQETRIEEGGTFAIPPLPNGKKRITVIVPGFRPETRMIEVSNLMDPLEFEMTGGESIHIQVVDGKTDEPIRDAFVSIDNWRSCKAIYNHQHPNVIDSQIPFRTNALGVYTWNWAPEDEVVYQVSAQGYSPNYRVPLSPSSETHIVKLFKPLTISGRVVDAETQETIPDFAVIPVVCDEQDKKPKFNGQRRHAMERGRSGRFRITLENEDYYRLRIEAEGYKPIVTDTAFKLGDEVPRFNLQLQPAAWSEGRVVNSEGSPVEAARVIFATNSAVAQLDSYRLNAIVDFANSTSTTKEGSFKVAQLDETATVIVMHKKHGYAEVTRRPGEELGELKLKPWVKVKGVLRDSRGRPVAGVRVSFEGMRYEFEHNYHVQDMTTATTDNQGRYEFLRLPAIRGAIRPLAHMTDKLRSEHSIPVDLASAAEHVVNVGGASVRVTGRVKLTGTELTGIDYSEARATMLPIAEPRHGLPTMLRDSDWRKGWNEVERIRKEHPFWSGRTYLGSFHKMQLHLDRNGGFETTIDAPGTYDIGTGLNVRAEQLGKGRFSHAIGQGSQRITITQEQFDSGVVDVGEIEIPAHPQLNVGDEVPDFEVYTAANETKRLSEYRGRYVLVDFWAAWCKVCKEDSGQLDELAAHLASTKSNAAILSVELPGSGNFKRGATDEEAKSVWTTSKLVYDKKSGAFGYEDVFKSLGVWSVPRYLVIDPEGKLVFHGQVQGAVQKMRELK